MSWTSDLDTERATNCYKEKKKEEKLCQLYASSLLDGYKEEVDFVIQQLELRIFLSC